MITNKVSAEYAGALFELSIEKGKQKDYYEDLMTISKSIKENPLFVEILVSPNVTLAQKIEVVDQTFGSLSEDVVSLVKLLCEKKRFDMFDFVCQDYEALYNEASKILPAKVRTAAPLSKVEEKRLVETLEKKSGNKVKLELEIDEKILGGMIIELDGKIIDGSLKTRLNRIKEVIDK